MGVDVDWNIRVLFPKCPDEDGRSTGFQEASHVLHGNKRDKVSQNDSQLKLLGYCLCNGTLKSFSLVHISLIYYNSFFLILFKEGGGGVGTLKVLLPNVIGVL